MSAICMQLCTGGLVVVEACLQSSCTLCIGGLVVVEAVESAGNFCVRQNKRLTASLTNSHVVVGAVALVVSAV